jgi:hypothetical protein
VQALHMQVVYAFQAFAQVSVAQGLQLGGLGHHQLG